MKKHEDICNSHLTRHVRLPCLVEVRLRYSGSLPAGTSLCGGLGLEKWNLTTMNTKHTPKKVTSKIYNEKIQDQLFESINVNKTSIKEHVQN